MKKRTFNLVGYTIEVWDFGYKQFYYPTFNGNAEFEVSSKGFRALYRYLRTLNWFKRLPDICDQSMGIKMKL